MQISLLPASLAPAGPINCISIQLKAQFLHVKPFLSWQISSAGSNKHKAHMDAVLLEKKITDGDNQWAYCWSPGCWLIFAENITEVSI